MARNDANKGTGARKAGIIVRITEKGFGFIQDEDGREYFVHFSNCAPGVWDEICKVVGKQKGKITVTFEPTQTDKGLRALNVQWVAKTAAPAETAPIVPIAPIAPVK